MKAILTYNKGVNLSKANPNLLRQALKARADLLQNQTRENKLLLLAYAMSDNAYQQMTGIKLLPMSNGIFGVFDSASKHPALLDSDVHPRLLLSGLSHWFVDQDVSEELKSQLTKAAQQNCKSSNNISCSVVHS